MTPSEKFKKPVIGTIKAQLTGAINSNGKNLRLEFPVDSFEVIDIIHNNGTTTYVCNEWNQDGIVQLVNAEFVKEFKRMENK